MLCGNCKEQHATADEVRKCYEIEVKEEPATDRQVSFINSLLAERDTAGLRRVVETIRQSCDRFISGEKISKADASKLINGLLGCDKKPEAMTPAIRDRWSKVPDGRYALRSERDGHVFFIEVVRPQQGKWVGWAFASLLLGSPGDWQRQKLRRDEQHKWLDEIQKDPIAAAQLFGDKTATCGRCFSPLSNPQSRAAGFGQTCASRVGWPYPSRSEALVMLRERKLSVPTDEEVAQLELAIATEGDASTPDWTI